MRPEEPLPPGWSKPKPDRTPGPCLWPPMAALGVTALAWGLVTSPLISCVGAGLLAAALAGWIGEMRHERNQGQGN